MKRVRDQRSSTWWVEVFRVVNKGEEENDGATALGPGLFREQRAKHGTHRAKNLLLDAKATTICLFTTPLRRSILRISLCNGEAVTWQIKGLICRKGVVRWTTVIFSFYGGIGTNVEGGDKLRYVLNSLKFVTFLEGMLMLRERSLTLITILYY